MQWNKDDCPEYQAALATYEGHRRRQKKLAKQEAHTSRRMSAAVWNLRELVKKRAHQSKVLAAAQTVAHLVDRYVSAQEAQEAELEAFRAWSRETWERHRNPTDGTLNAFTQRAAWQSLCHAGW